MSGSDGGVGEGIVSQAIAEAVEAIKVFASEGLFCLMMVMVMDMNLGLLLYHYDYMQ